MINLFEDSENFKKFWLMTRIDSGYEMRVKELANMKLNGVKGISSSKEIVTEWWMIGRNTMLVMDRSAVEQINDLEMVKYDDLDYLFSDYMRPLYRIWQKDPDTKQGRWGLYQNLVEYTLNNISDPAIKSHYAYYGYTKIIDDIYNTPVSSLHDAAKLLHSALAKEMPIELSKIEEYMATAVLRVGSLYSSESEWLLKDSVLNIPPNSMLVIGISKDTADAVRIRNELRKENKEPDVIFTMRNRDNLENFDEITSMIKEHNLADKYIIKFADSTKFDKQRDIVKTRRYQKSKDY